MRCGVLPEPAFALSAFALSCVISGACGGDAENPGAASAAQSSSSSSGSSASSSEGVAQGGEGGSLPIDPDDPCSSLDAPSSPPARVVWLREHRTELDLSREVAFDWAFRYAVKVPPGGARTTTLELELCIALAGEDERCEASALPPPNEGCSVMRGPRFGLDPGLYNEGDNRYTFTLRLLRDGVPQSQDSFVILLHYRPY